jgi:hypothetical protein
MTLHDIQLIFNRALEKCLDRTKWLLCFSVLALCGLLVVFSRALSEHANAWMGLSLTFFPIFLSSGLILALGVVLIRGYHDEIKKGEASYSKILASSWETVIGAAYFAIPFLLIYLMLWMLIGIFILLRNLPAVGEFFGVILSFAPFLLNFATLVLTVSVIAMLFFVAPVIALKGMSRSLVSQVLSRRLAGDLFSNLLLFAIALLPLVLYLGLLLASAFLTGSFCVDCVDPVATVIEWFFIMIPFAALLAPAVIFFFNFAAEAHVIAQKHIKA